MSLVASAGTDFQGSIMFPRASAQTDSRCELAPKEQEDKMLSLGYVCVHKCGISLDKWRWACVLVECWDD